MAAMLHVADSIREEDPNVWVCSDCDGVLVENPAKATVCPKCGAEPCPGCVAKRKAGRSGRVEH